MESWLGAKLEQIGRRTAELVSLTQELVRHDTQNTPPTGKEGPCQKFIADFLRDAGLETRCVPLGSVKGLTDHPLYCAGREYADRPNVLATFAGNRGGRSLLFSGHVDTMPASRTGWTHDPWTPVVENGDLYGLGAFDMKGGLAVAMCVLRWIREWGLRPGGSLLFESVVDEEHAGCNGTLANRLCGHTADVVVIPEPSGLKVYCAHKGFRIAHVTLTGRGGISFAGERTVNPVEYLCPVIAAVRDFRARRRQHVVVHPLYREDPDPVPVMLTKLSASEFSSAVPMQIPETCKLEVYWQTMPGETQEQVEREFLGFMREHLAGTELAKNVEVTFAFSHRWMPGTATNQNHAFVRAACAAAAALKKNDVRPVGAPYPCDLFVFSHFGIPGVVLGPGGRNAHAGDERVSVASLTDLARTFLLLVHKWNGLECGG